MTLLTPFAATRFCLSRFATALAGARTALRRISFAHKRYRSHI
jgi:hypothetical protein